MVVLATEIASIASTILDLLAPRICTVCNLSTLASFGLSALREQAAILHWQHCVILLALSMFGWHVYVHYVFNWNAHLDV